MRLYREEAAENSIDLTPLIDVVFLLLIFFLAATTFSKDEVEMDLTLPEARSGEAGASSKLLVISVSKEGQLLVDGRSVTTEGLQQKLLAAARRNKDQEVLIRGDRKAQFGLVAQVFDACLSASLRAVSIGAVPIPTAGGRGK